MMRKAIIWAGLILGISLSSCSNEEVIVPLPTPANNEATVTDNNSGSDGSLQLATTYLCSNVLIDATHDGGVWWFPQYQSFNPLAYRQGAAFAEHLTRSGFSVTELPRGLEITTGILENYQVIIRMVGFGNYSEGEINAYKEALDRGATVVLIGDHMNHNPGDQLAESLGVKMSGVIYGEVTVFDNESLFDGVSSLNYLAGAALSSDSENFKPIAWVEEHVAAALMKYNQNTFLVIGEANLIESVPQPFTDRFVQWIGSGCSSR